jgi:hypothetical protein
LASIKYIQVQSSEASPYCFGFWPGKSHNDWLLSAPHLCSPSEGVVSSSCRRRVPASLYGRQPKIWAPAKNSLFLKQSISLHLGILSKTIKAKDAYFSCLIFVFLLMTHDLRLWAVTKILRCPWIGAAIGDGWWGGDWVSTGREGGLLAVAPSPGLLGGGGVEVGGGGVKTHVAPVYSNPGLPFFFLL